MEYTELHKDYLCNKKTKK